MNTAKSCRRDTCVEYPHANEGRATAAQETIHAAAVQQEHGKGRRVTRLARADLVEEAAAEGIEDVAKHVQRRAVGVAQLDAQLAHCHRCLNRQHRPLVPEQASA
jgi:hypothetical protein